MELLGIFIQGTDINTMEPIIAPKCLLQINGGHAAVDVANCLISVIAKHITIKGSAYKIQSYLERIDHDYDLNVSPLEDFKLGVMHHVNKNKENCIETKNMPINNTSDGVALNGRISRLLCLDAPCCHYAAHNSDLVMKRMVKSKTLSVGKTCDFLQRVIKLFEMSTKSKANMNEALAVLEMNQLKLISWGGTRMAYFVTACKQFTELLLAVYNFMYSADIKKEEWDALFTFLMNGLKPLFKDIFLHKMNKGVMTV